MTALLSAQSNMRSHIASRLPYANAAELQALAQIQCDIETAIREQHAQNTALESLSTQLDKALTVRTSRRAA